MKIHDQTVSAGEQKTIELHVANLPTRTEINIPVTLYNSGEDGPTLLLMAGLHGDEINGIEIIRQILEQKHNQVKRGKVICIPILNIFGFIHFSREVPDGKDVNRSFPGFENGSLASKVAHLLMNEIIPHIDYGIDFHTGGAQISNYPQTRAVMTDKKNKELADYFCAPLRIHSDLIDNSLRWAAAKAGKPILVYEGGESMRLNANAVDEGVNGALRVMKGLNMTDEAPAQEKNSIDVKKRTWLRCNNSGIWILMCEEGEKVSKDQCLGYTTSPFVDFRSEIRAPKDGVIISINYMCVVNKGDALIHLGIIEAKNE